MFIGTTGQVLKAQSDCDLPLIAGTTGTLNHFNLNVTLTGSTTDTLFMDVDQDGNNDFALNANFFSFPLGCTSETAILLLTPDAEIITDTLNPARLDSDDSISVCKYWKNSTNKLVFAGLYIEPGYLMFGNWYVQGNGYMGFRIIHPNDTVYGWIQLSSIVNETGSQLTVIDYAVQSNLNSIQEEVQQTGIEIFPNPADDFINLEIPGNIEYFDFCILNSTGQIVLQKNHFNQKQIFLNSLPKGLYVIAIKSDKYLHQEKFIKQ